MVRKITSLFTLAAFVFASTSCLTTRARAVTSVADIPGGRAKILSLVKISGERVDFAQNDPGRVRGGAIVGTAIARIAVPVEVKGPISDIRKRPNGSVYALTDGSGRVYSVDAVLREAETGWSILINDHTSQPVSIPLDEVSRITYRKVNPLLTFAGIALPVAIGLVLFAAYLYARDI